MLHLHGTEVMFDEFLDYPVQIINWHDRETRPSLILGQQRFRGVVCGGLQREKTMVLVRLKTFALKRYQPSRILAVSA